MAMKNTEENRLEHIARRMEQDKSEDAPADSIRYAMNLFRTRAAEPKASVIQRVLAVMSVDLAPNRAAFGERSTGTQGVRQMLFEAGENSIDLRFEKNGAKFTLTGQILGTGFESAVIEITNATSSYTGQTNAMSEFKIENVAMGTYILALTGKDKALVIENFKID